MRYIFLSIFLFLGAQVALVQAQDLSAFTKIVPSDQVAIDLRYGTTNNFMHENMYGEFQTAYLHPMAALKLWKAAKILQALKPGWKLLIWDALRPRSIQRKMFDHVKGTPEEHYVGNPDKGSVHNFGFAVDLSAQDEKGNPVDMGTDFDNFTELAQPKLEASLLKQGKLTKAQVENRKILRKAMTEAGFAQLPIEWWHYDALPPKEVRAKYEIFE